MLLSTRCGTMIMMMMMILGVHGNRPIENDTTRGIPHTVRSLDDNNDYDNNHFPSSTSSMLSLSSMMMMRQLPSTEDEEDFDLSISLSFSLWYPGYHDGVLLHRETGDSFLFLGRMMSVLTNFLCRRPEKEEEEEGGGDPRFDVRSSDGTSSLCPHPPQQQQQDDNGLDPFDFMMATYSPSSLKAPILATGETTTLALKSLDVHDDNSSGKGPSRINWMEWNVTYVVIELARSYWTLDPTGSLEGYPIRHDHKLQTSVQTLLDDAVRDGSLSGALQELVDSSLPLFSVTGDEVDTLKEPYETLMRQYDFMEGARTIRYVGMAVGLCTLLAVMTLSMAGRRRRWQKESSMMRESPPPPPPVHEPADLAVPPPDPPHLPSRPHTDVALLDTEEAVNHMLLLGKHQVLMGTPSTPPPPHTTSRRT